MQELQNDLVRELLKEKRKDRRWKNIRFFLWFLLISVVIYFVFSENGPETYGDGGPGYVSFVRLNGSIDSGQDFSAEVVIPLLRDAFTDTDAKGVVLDIDSGGGSPVQASIIHDAILEFKKKYHKKVIVVGEDLLASGAYYVAVAADKIYVNPNTLTGSIGVIMKSFGFADVIKKVGVERRVYASGAYKDRLDPFLPQNQQDIEKIKTVIDEVHQNFDRVVLEGRKGKLHATPDELFSGDFWSGETAVKLGLVDGLGNLSDVIATEFHVTRYKDYGRSPGMFKSLLGQVGTSFSLALSDRQVKVSEKI